MGRVWLDVSWGNLDYRKWRSIQICEARKPTRKTWPVFADNDCPICINSHGWNKNKTNNTIPPRLDSLQSILKYETNSVNGTLDRCSSFSLNILQIFTLVLIAWLSSFHNGEIELSILSKVIQLVAKTGFDSKYLALEATHWTLHPVVSAENTIKLCGICRKPNKTLLVMPVTGIPPLTQNYRAGVAQRESCLFRGSWGKKYLNFVLV